MILYQWSVLKFKKYYLEKFHNTKIQKEYRNMGNLKGQEWWNKNNSEVGKFYKFEPTRGNI